MAMAFWNLFKEFKKIVKIKIIKKKTTRIKPKSKSGEIFSQETNSKFGDLKKKNREFCDRIFPIYLFIYILA